MKRKFFLVTSIVILIIVAGIIYFSASKKRLTEKVEIPQEITTVRIAYLPLVQPLLIAEGQGYFKAVGLDVRLEKMPNANLAMEALSRGDVDGTGAIAYSTLLAFENAAPNRFRIYHGSSETKDTGWSSLIVKKGKGITSPAELEGKKIVMRSGLSSKSQGEMVIKALGLEITDVEFVQVESSLLVQTFMKEEISAFLDIQPFAETIVQKGLGEVLIKSPRAKYILDPYPQAAGVLSRDFIAKNPQAAKKFKTAVEKAIDFMRQNDRESRLIFQQSLGLEENISLNMPIMKFEKITEIDRLSIGKLADLGVKDKVLDKKPDIINMFFED